MYKPAIPLAADSLQFTAQNHVIFLENLAGEPQRKVPAGK
jgi:hypothetical protein